MRLALFPAALAIGLGAPLWADAASLSPLDGPLPVDTADRGSAATPLAETNPKSGALADTDFRFVEGDILTVNPLGEILPENQWANPGAANRRLSRR